MGPYGQDSVERFRVRTTGPIGLSKPVLRLRMERQIGVDALHPQQLPSSAILIVRELAVKSGFPGAAIPLAGWSASLRRQLAALITLAVRPIDGAPPTTARCVLFADEGEFLACLTRDTIGHVVQQRWYWSHLVGHETVNQVHLLAKIWQDRPIAIPAALQLLTFHERRAVVSLFDEVQRTAITHALYHTFKLPGAWPSSGPVLRPRENQQTTAGQPERRADSAVHPLAPWHPWLAGRHVVGLPPSAEQLLGVGLGLAAAPAVVRSKAFVTRAQAWIAEAQTHRFEPATQTQHTVRVGDPGHIGPSQRGPGAEAGNSPPTSGNTPAHGVLADGRLPKHAEARLRLPPETSQQQSVSLRSQLPPFTSADQEKHPVPFGQGIEERSSDRQQAAIASGASLDGVPTELAGMFYLVHLVAKLDLTGDASESPIFGIGASSWAILEAIGRGLLGVHGAGYATDPIWRVLATLDRRDPAAPLGTGCRRQADFRLPPAWLQAIHPAEATWLAGISNRRLRVVDTVRHYVVADVGLHGRSMTEVIDAEVTRYRNGGVDPRVNRSGFPPLPRLPGVVRDSLSPAFAWWLRRTLGFVRHLLARSLRCPADELDKQVRGLLCRPGHVVITRTHIDLHQTLAEINLAARIAGLDRDPGWSPDFGHVIFFHFE